MEIVPIYEPYLYSIQYDGNADSEYDRLFDLWNDVNYVSDFMSQHAELLQNMVWHVVPEPELAARQVLREARELERYFETLAKNTKLKVKPDFDSHFQFLDGQYAYEIEYIPMKSYGTDRPSFLRFYAIKLSTNTYIITGGGIKLTKKIKDAPDLKDHVLKNINCVRKFLILNGIVDKIND